jgi:glutaredoxin 3
LSNVEDEMAKIEIYTTPWCGYCARAKALLDRKGIAYEEIDVSSTPGAREQMIQRAEGRRTVPQIFVDGRHLGDSDEIVALERTGQLDAMLNPA